MHQRTVLFRTLIQSAANSPTGEAAGPLNVNDEIGLAPEASYHLEEHLTDLASIGIQVVGQESNIVSLSDGTIYFFEEIVVPIELDKLDPYMRDRILSQMEVAS